MAGVRAKCTDRGRWSSVRLGVGSRRPSGACGECRSGSSQPGYHGVLIQSCSSGRRPTRRPGRGESVRPSRWLRSAWAGLLHCNAELVADLLPEVGFVALDNLGCGSGLKLPASSRFRNAVGQVPEAQRGSLEVFEVAADGFGAAEPKLSNSLRRST